jgi:hypothetical protein
MVSQTRKLFSKIYLKNAYLTYEIASETHSKFSHICLLLLLACQLRPFYILVATLHMRRKVGMLNHTIFQVNHLTNNDAATIDEIYRQLKVGPY